MRRRIVAAGAAAVVLAGGGVTIGAAWASGSSDATAPVKATQLTAEQILDAISDPANRADYDLPVGDLVSAEVCVDGKCASRTFSDAPVCDPGADACIGTAMISTKLRGGVMITAELA